jgi:predicted nucleic acid-binding Zn ribbon protein
MTRKPKLVSLGEALGEYLGRKGLAKRVDLASAVDRWAEAVGPQVAAATEAEAVTADGILWIRVNSSAWAMEISLMAPRILARLNVDRTGRIRELRCVVRGRSQGNTGQQAGE